MVLVTWRGGDTQNRHMLKSSEGKFRSQGAQINLLGKEDPRCWGAGGVSKDIFQALDSGIHRAWFQTMTPTYSL